MQAVQIIGSLIGLAILIFLLVDVWRSPLPTGPKVGWTIGAILCGLITLIVWLVAGRKRAYGGTT